MSYRVVLHLSREKRRTKERIYSNCAMGFFFRTANLCMCHVGWKELNEIGVFVENFTKRERIIRAMYEYNCGLYVHTRM